MKIGDLQDYIKEEHLEDFYDIETLFARLICDNKIRNFSVLLYTYLQKVEESNKYTKAELAEASSLLHMRRLNIDFPHKKERELHIINKYSTLSCNEENQAEGYDPIKGEEMFKKIYNL